MTAVDIERELQKLERMRDTGSLSEEEFQRAKAALLAGEGVQTTPSPSPPPPPPRRSRRVEDEDDYPDDRPRASDRDTNQWAMFIHLSQFAGFIVPFGGLVLPIVLWQIKKNDLPGVDQHGKNVVNWIISVFIYALVCIPLIFVIVGIFLLITLAILNLIFPIIGAVKANNGEVWKYPMAITFIK